jgi:hypothetical protein
MRRRQIVAARFGKRQKFGAGDDANSMVADVLFRHLAIAGAEESSHRIGTAGLQDAAQNILCQIVHVVLQAKLGLFTINGSSA